MTMTKASELRDFLVGQRLYSFTISLPVADRVSIEVETSGGTTRWLFDQEEAKIAVELLHDTIKKTN